MMETGKEEKANKPYRSEEGIEARKWYWKTKAERVIRALKKNGFDAEYFQRGEEAVRKVIEVAAPAQVIGLGGSVTIRDLKIADPLQKLGKTVLDHWTGIPPGQEEDMRIRRAHLTCDLFLTSANAITLKGEIVNIDGAGNRTNAMSFGPKKVVFLIGINKIVGDIEEGIRRIHEVAAPLNARRGGYKTPCYETGVCTPSSPGLHICCITLVLNRKPMVTDISVYLIGENLGL
jgi:hypothetical protein